MRRLSRPNEFSLDPSHVFTRDEVCSRLDAAMGRTLEEVDSKHVFDNPTLNKGIAGHVIEESVLGYPKDSRQEHDIEVDGVPTEVKTTGLKLINGKYVAKEPVSITAVAIDTIVKEEFFRSHFWDKVRQILFVYYLYDYDGGYNAQEYRRFVLKGYELRIVPEEDRVILESDWTIVRDFIRDVQTRPNPEQYYPDISHQSLMYLDVAPKYPNSPRFRFKRAYANSFIQEYFYGSTQQKLSFVFDRYSQFDAKCRQLTEAYGGMTVSELLDRFGIVTDKIHKAISERVVLGMFDTDVGKINQIGIFNKLGLIGKTIVQSTRNGRTEDMKLFKINFDEIRDRNLKFEDSEFYSYFKDNQILAILFQEQTRKDVRFEDNRFVGFKRISFSDEFIDTEVRSVWMEIRRLVNDGELKEIFDYRKDGSIRMTPKTNVPISAPNFPKSDRHIVFVRGSGVDKSYLPLEINGIRMLTQYLWIRGADMVDIVNSKKNY